MRAAARAAGGHATLFAGRRRRHGSRRARFDALSAPLERIHRALMHEFDPACASSTAAGSSRQTTSTEPAMQTELAPEFQGTADGREAEAILRKCVHCGFCTATCPTYQLLGDELDGPRGRIYLIKQVLEGKTPTRSTQLHLDRCLTCRNCETTCPSGVQYGHLVDIGRKIVDEKVPRPALRIGRALDAEGGAAVAAVRPGDEARPGGARPAAGEAQGQGAARSRTPAPGPRARMRARC